MDSIGTELSMHDSLNGTEKNVVATEINLIIRQHR